MALPPDYIRRAVYAKYFLRRAEELLKKRNPLAAGEAVITLQDAAEILMRVVADHCGLPPRVDFPEFWSKMTEKTGFEPPHRASMARLNSARVDFKHKGNLPNPVVAADISSLVQDFCSQLCSQHLGLDFSHLSMAELVSRDAVKKLVQESEKLFEAGSHQEAMEKLALAADELYWNARLEAGGVLMEPPREELHSARVPSGEAQRLYDTAKRLVADHKKLADTVNMLLLGADLHAFLFFNKLTPRVSRTGYEGKHVSVAWPYGFPNTPIDERTFLLCRDFVIEFSLRNDELFRA